MAPTPVRPHPRMPAAHLFGPSPSSSSPPLSPPQAEIHGTRLTPAPDLPTSPRVSRRATSHLATSSPPPRLALRNPPPLLPRERHVGRCLGFVYIGGEDGLGFICVGAMPASCIWRRTEQAVGMSALETSTASRAV